MLPAKLLPPGALAGVRLGISVSDSPDLDRLGLTDTHVRLALSEVVRRVLVGGGTLAYGGHLGEKGYTPFLMDELRRYGSPTNNPLLVCLAWPVHRGLRLSEIDQARERLGLYGVIECLDADGKVVAPDLDRGDAPVPVAEEEEERQAYAAMRRYMRSRTHGRFVAGGKRAEFQGAIPGIMEEVLIALEEPEQPVYLAGGFGGATADTARALGVDALDWLPEDPNGTKEDARVQEGRLQLQALRKTRGRRRLANGLTPKENRRLAGTHRPSEVADLVALGLGRVFAKA